MILITTAGKVGALKATALRAAGVDVVEGNLDDPGTIDVAMRGISSIVLVSPPVVAQELNVIASAIPPI
jgi:uncharacterized protein YbjT (DUF2867 family)